MLSIRKIYNLYFSNDKKLVHQLTQILGFVPENLILYKIAFYHKSMNHVNNKYYQHNERLEFLGDSLINSIVAEYLFNKYPTANEGFLTKMRSRIVKRRTLNKIATAMGIDVILSEYSQGTLSSSMKGNAFEAVIGAIYLDKGYHKTKNYLIQKILMNYINVDEIELKDDNFKSQLLEWGQKNNVEVNFKLINKYKHDKRDKFKVAILINNNIISEADDYNKKSAEQSAAKIAIKKMDLT